MYACCDDLGQLSAANPNDGLVTAMPFTRTSAVSLCGELPNKNLTPFGIVGSSEGSMNERS